MQIFFEVVLPVVLVFALGFLIQKWKSVDIKPISTVAIYVMTPCLVFDTLYHATLNMQYAYMLIFAIMLLLILIILNKLVSFFFKLSPEKETGIILSTAFMNAGNYGAPIVLFAFGEEGFAYAVTLMVIQSVIMNSFGVYYATKGRGTMIQALKVVVTMPATWALAAALLAQFLPAMPVAITDVTEMVGIATIPTVMIVLGMQLAQIPLRGFEWKKISYNTVIRLLISPLIAVGLTSVLPIEPLLANVLILTAAMPTAANIVMFSVQFNAQPRLVASTTLVTTLISIPTVTILLAIL
ncbi:AEC family transporter [Salicibibacter halophilus]|uniref:AEC family transporter n=1 Tax=Salicibibacter halophilus TaxID=2502791 RepID=A0A514LLP2_9BACI|nr:AEC family transporter [Salicibibacter halophilus]QDI92746.1 AEC family transporter [Salicibibacter halophilus]